MQQAQLEPYKVCSPVYFDGKWWVIAETTQTEYRLLSIVPKVFYGQDYTPPEQIFFNLEQRSKGEVKCPLNQRWGPTRELDLMDWVYFYRDSSFISAARYLGASSKGVRLVVNDKEIKVKPETMFYFTEID